MTKVFAFLLIVLAVGGSSAANAHSHKKKGLEIVHPWVHARSADDTSTAVVCMKIRNRSGRPDRLLGATTSVAANVELQGSEPGASAAEPKRPTAFAIAAGADFELKSGGPHLVLTGVKKSLHAYDQFKMTFLFEKAGRMLVDVVVEEASTEEPHKH